MKKIAPLKPFKNFAFEEVYFGGSRAVVPANYVKMVLCQVPVDVKKHQHPKLSRSESDFEGVLGGGGGIPELCQNICVKYLLISKKTGTLA